MSFCSNCGVALESGTKFCRNCGVPVEEAANAQPPVSSVPVATEPVCQTYNVPVRREVVVPGKVKALGFVGMGLSIGGTVFASLGLLYTLIFMMLDGALAFGYSIGFGMFSIPASIVGGVLCNKSIDQGNSSTVCSIGIKLRLAGIIVSAVMFFFGILALAISV